MDRLLESKADTAFGTLSNAEICNVFSVKQDLTAGRCMNAGNDAGKCGFTATVRTGDRHKMFINRQIDIF